MNPLAIPQAGTPSQLDIYAEESAKMSASFAVNHSLKNQGVCKDMTDQLDIVASSELQDVVAQTATPVAPLTKKQKKQMKYAQKNMMGRLRTMQRQGQSQHIMGKLSNHVHYTPEQIIQLKAGNAAKEELALILGPRQAEAFFTAKADTLCHDFFPAPTVAANPTLMTAADGTSRTLAQVYEYFIYKHHMLLTNGAGTKETLQLSEDWATSDIKQLDIPVEAVTPVESAEELDQTAQGDIA